MSQDLCVVGFVYLEVVVPSHEPPAPGTERFVDALPMRLGGALNTASVARALGAEVALAYPTGDGIGAAGIERAVERLALAPRSWPVAGEPAVSLVLHGARDRAFVSAADFAGLGACPGLPAARWIHVAGLAEAEALAGQLARAREAGARVSVSASWVPELLDGLARRRDRPWDLLFLSGAESRRIAAEPEAAFDAARGCADHIVVTDGARGAAVRVGQNVTWLPAQDADVVDTTGAGDAFAAGYLTATLRGAGPVDATGFANRVAARMLGRPGGVADDPALFADLRETS